MSFRTAWSLLLGGAADLRRARAARSSRAGAIATVSYKAIVGWTVWPGAAILVASGLTSFALDWRSVARSFSRLGAVFEAGARREHGASRSTRSSAPAWWFPAGFVVLAPIVDRC